MFKIEIIADNASELKEKLDGLVESFGVGQQVENNVVEVKDEKTIEKTVDKNIEKAAEPKPEEKASEIKVEDSVKEESEEVEENIATKMTYWLAGGEYGSSRKGAVIPDEAKIFGSKSAWDASKDQSEEEEEETTTKTNFPVEDAEPVEKSTIIDKMGELLRANGSVKKEIVGLMARFDGSRFSEIAEKDYAEFYAGLMSIEKGGE